MDLSLQSIQSQTVNAALDPFGGAFSQFPSLVGYRQWLQSQGGADGVMQTAAVIEADLNADGRKELIVQFTSYPSGKLGQATNLPTPNRLVVFGLSETGTYQDLTAQYFPHVPGGIVSLDGRVAAFATGDLNADGFTDLAFAVNRADGRLIDGNIAAKSASMISKGDGTYTMVQTDVSMRAESVLVLEKAGLVGPEVVFGSPALNDQVPGFVQRFGLENLGQTTTLKSKGAALASNAALVSTPGAASINQKALAIDQSLGVVQFEIGPDGAWIQTGNYFPLDVSETSFAAAVGTIGEFGVEAITKPAFTSGDSVYLIKGIDAATSLIPSKGADSVLLVAVRFQLVNGSFDDNGVFIISSLGQEVSTLKLIGPGVYEPQLVDTYLINGLEPIASRVYQIKTIDLNADGHQDIVLSFQGVSPGLSMFVNNGVGNFYPVNQQLLPDPTDFVRGSVGSLFPVPLSAQESGLSGVVYLNAPPTYNSGNGLLFKVTAGLGTGPDLVDPTVLGAPGFNEHYYLENNSEALAAVETGLVSSGLAHYLSAGKPQGAMIFAPGSWVRGGDSGELIRLREGAEIVWSGSGNDTIYPLEGSDLVDAGLGTDIVVYTGERSQYQVSKTKYNGLDAWQVIDPNAGETDILLGVEKLQFAQAFEDDPKTEVTLDITGSAAVAYRMYRAAFARDPDFTGLGFWVDILTKYNDPSLLPHENLLLLTVARDFTVSPEFIDTYGADLTNEDYVRALYLNTLRREPDESGFGYWTSLLNQSILPREHLLVYFSEGPENSTAVASLIGQGIEYIPFGG